MRKLQAAIQSGTPADSTPIFNEMLAIIKDLQDTIATIPLFVQSADDHAPAAEEATDQSE
jgi:hypothetical protein